MYEGPIDLDRIRLLLRERAPAWGSGRPNARRLFYAYVAALQTAARHATPELAEACAAAEAAAWAHMRAAEERAWDKAHAHAVEDWADALVCPMRAPNVRGLTERECGERRVCFLCGKWPIPPRRQHWCSDACVARWTENHEWTAARNAAVRRDHERCVRCGSPARQAPSTCARCGTPWPCEAAGAQVFGGGHYRLPGARRELQVNHKDPRYGRGYHKGCHHHQNRLETLCQPCHVAETNEQRTRRANGGHPDAEAAPPPT